MHCCTHQWKWKRGRLDRVGPTRPIGMAPSSEKERQKHSVPTEYADAIEAAPASSPCRRGGKETSCRFQPHPQAASTSVSTSTSPAQQRAHCDCYRLEQLCGCTLLAYMDRGKARRPLNSGLRRMGHILPHAKAVEAWELVSHHNQIMTSR
ncbi:hypothetical protein LZ31DRAFT_45646 [Colletotrichum somersetense]|nr:hypothetical protein LZ31DRAFT_45646 [Colletotrichum somersetense]